MWCIHRSIKVFNWKIQQRYPTEHTRCENDWLKRELNENNLKKLKRLEAVAHRRGQTMTEFSLAWVLRDSVVSSLIIGARTPEQIIENTKAIQNLSFSLDELEEIRDIIKN